VGGVRAGLAGRFDGAQHLRSRAFFVQIYDPLATQVGINDTDRKAAIDKVRDS
jgi:hypothetical protein